MILRSIIFILITYFFINDYLEKRQKYKLSIFIVIACAYLNGVSYFNSIDERIRLSIMVISALIGLFYIYKRYNDYKIEKFELKKEARGEESYKKEISMIRGENHIESNNENIIIIEKSDNKNKAD